MGYRVLVTDAFSQRPAFAIADLHEVADITDRKATLEVARRHRIEGILCDTTDVGVATAAWVAEALRLPGIGYETSLAFTDKGRMRGAARRAGLPSPPFATARTKEQVRLLAEEIGWPAVVKPVDNQSGRGVSIVRSKAELDAAVSAALDRSARGEVVVEQCLPGTEIIVDSFTVERCVHLLGVARKTPYPDNPTISSRIAYPASFPSLVMARIAEVNAGLIRALGLVTGITHAEYMVTDSDVYPLDIAARGGGVHIYTHAVPHVSGVDLNRAMIRFAMGEAVSIAPREVPLAASIDFMRAPAGVVAEILGGREASMAPGIAAVHFNATVGDRMGALGAKDDRLGFVVALADSLSEAIARAEAATAQIRVRMEGGTMPVPVT